MDFCLYIYANRKILANNYLQQENNNNPESIHHDLVFLKMYKELGGEILTFGSDAHDSSHIGYGFKDAAILAQSLGFRGYHTFKDMKPTFHEFQ